MSTFDTKPVARDQITIKGESTQYLEVRKQFESQQLNQKSKFKQTDRSRSILVQRPNAVTEDHHHDGMQRDIKPDLQLPSSQYMGVGPRDYSFLSTNRSVF